MHKYNVFPQRSGFSVLDEAAWTMPKVASTYISSPVYFWPHGSSSTCHIIFNTRPEGQQPSWRFQSRWSSSKTNHVHENHHFDSAPRGEKPGWFQGSNLRVVILSLGFIMRQGLSAQLRMNRRPARQQILPKAETHPKEIRCMALLGAHLRDSSRTKPPNRSTCYMFWTEPFLSAKFDRLGNPDG